MQAHAAPIPAIPMAEAKEEKRIIDVKSLFDEICELALEGNEAALQSFSAQNKCLQVRYYHSHYFHTPASSLAATGKHDAVRLLFKIEEGTLDSIIYGYALAGNTTQVEFYLKKYFGSINAALCGYIARQSPDEVKIVPFIQPEQVEEKIAVINTGEKQKIDFVYDRMVQDMLNRGASINVAARAYAKLGTEMGVRLAQGLIAQGASVIAALEGYAQCGDSDQVNSLIAESKVDMMRTKYKLLYRYALGNHDKLSLDEDTSHYNIARMQGCAQRGVEIQHNGMDMEVRIAQVCCKIHAYAISGLSEEANTLIRLYSVLQAQANPGYAHGGNTRLMANGMRGRNLRSVKNLLRTLVQHRDHFDYKLRDYPSFGEMAENGEWLALSALINYNHKRWPEIFKGFSHIFYSKLFESGYLSREENALRTFYFLPAGPVRTALANLMWRDIRNPGSGNAIHYDLASIQHRAEQMLDIGNLRSYNFNQALAWTDPIVRIAIYEQLALQSGLIQNEQVEVQLETVPEIFHIILQYLTPLSNVEVQKLIQDSKEDHETTLSEFNLAVKAKAANIELIYGASCQNQQTDRLNQVVELTNNIQSAVDTNQPGPYDALRDTQLELARLAILVETPESLDMAQTKLLIGWIQNLRFWNRQVPSFTLGRGDGHEIITTKVGDIKVPRGIKYLNECVDAFPDWETNPASMKKLRHAFLFGPGFPLSSRKNVTKFGEALCRHSRLYGTTVEDFKNETIVSMNKIINDQNLRAKEVFQKVKDTTEQYFSRLAPNSPDYEMMKSLKDALGQPNTENEYFDSLKHYTSKLNQLKMSNQPAKSPTWQVYLKEICLFLRSIVKAAISYNRYRTFSYMKPENERLRTYTEETIKDLQLQHPQQFEIILPRPASSA